MIPLPAPLPQYDRDNEAHTRTGLEKAITTLEQSSGRYTPVVTSSGGGETMTYSVQTGLWIRWGAVIWFSAAITLASKAGGSGDIRVSLPVFASAKADPPISVRITAMSATWTGAPVANVSSGTAFLRVQEFAAGVVAAAWTKLGATGVIQVAGIYQAA